MARKLNRGVQLQFATLEDRLALSTAHGTSLQVLDHFGNSRLSSLADPAGSKNLAKPGMSTDSQVVAKSGGDALGDFGELWNGIWNISTTVPVLGFPLNVQLGYDPLTNVVNGTDDATGGLVMSFTATLAKKGMALKGTVQSPNAGSGEFKVLMDPKNFSTFVGKGHFTSMGNSTVYFNGEFRSNLPEDTKSASINTFITAPSVARVGDTVKIAVKLADGGVQPLAYNASGIWIDVLQDGSTPIMPWISKIHGLHDAKMSDF